MKTQELTPEAKGILLQQWYQTSLDLKELKEKEDHLRTQVFEQFFTETKEGTNTVLLARGYKLKAVTGLNREVDIVAFEAMKTQELTPEAKGVLLQQWYQTSLDLKELKEKEDRLRMQVFEQFFTETKEGTNTVLLARGYKLKAVTGLNREVDIVAFEAMKKALANNHIKADKIVEFKPKLGLKYYRTLDESELKLVDQFLIISEAKPQISIVIPKGE